MILAGFLSGCAGLSAEQSISAAAGGPDSDAAGNAAGLTLRGKAINSYLENALVFSDANADGRYSLGESFALTDALGNYLLSNPALAPLVVKSLSNLSDVERSAIESVIPADQVDQFRALRTTQLASDNTKRAWDGMMTTSVTVLKDGESINITPYSTLHQALSKTMSPEDAQKLLLEVYGVAPNQDYIADVSQQLLDPAIQTNAVAVSNLIKVAVQNWGDVVSPDQIFTSLASQLLDVTNQLNEMGIPLSKASDLFARTDQIKEIYVTLLKQLDIEIQIADLNQVIQTAADLNKDYMDTSSLRLVNDTGSSSFDYVTADWRVDKPNGDAQTTEYLLKERDALSGGYDINGSEVWVKDLTELQEGLTYKPVNDGYYRLYVRDTSLPSASPEFVTYYFDSHAPTFSLGGQTLLVEDTGISGVGATFSDKITSNIQLNQNSLGQLLTQDNGSDLELYYFVTKNTGNLAPANDTLWLDFINFPRDSTANNGDQITVWLKAVDSAGNASSPQSFQFQFDPNAPAALPVSEVSLARDTGFISKDWISQSLEINSLSSWADRNQLVLEYSLVRVDGQVSADPGWSRSYVAPTIDGQYRLDIRQLDLAGNVSDVLSIDATRDTLAPVAIASGELYLAHDTSDLGGANLSGTGTHQLDLKTADPTVLGLRLPESWFEYKVTQSESEDITLIHDWARNLQIDADGDYTVYVRRTDLAGNYEDLGRSFDLQYDGTRPTIQLGEDFLATSYQDMAQFYQAFQNAIESDADHALYFNEQAQINYDDIRLTQVSALSQDLVGHYSNLIQASYFSDQTSRQAMLVSSTDPTAVRAIERQNGVWDGVSSNNLPIDYRVVGQGGNDYFRNIDSGDIFIGGQGYDIAQFATEATVLGIGFVTPSEQSALLNLVDGVIEGVDGNNLIIGSTPLLKVFSQSPFDQTEEGLSFIQADLIRYADSDSHWQNIFLTKDIDQDFWSVQLSNVSNYFFFDGSGLMVRGGNQGDELVGGTGNDFFYTGASGAGTDKLSGGLGNDILLLGAYEYQVADRSIALGGSGDDRMVMLSGHIEATGNDGADSFFVAPAFYNGNTALNISIKDFAVGDDRLYIPESFNQHLLDYTSFSEQGTSMTIDLHGLSLNVDGMKLAYGSVMDVMFQEAINIPDSSEVIAQLILGDDTVYEGWADLQSVMNLWV